MLKSYLHSFGKKKQQQQNLHTKFSALGEANVNNLPSRESGLCTKRETGFVWDSAGTLWCFCEIHKLNRWQWWGDRMRGMTGLPAALYKVLYCIYMSERMFVCYSFNFSLHIVFCSICMSHIMVKNNCIIQSFLYCILQSICVLAYKIANKHIVKKSQDPSEQHTLSHHCEETKKYALMKE